MVFIKRVYDLYKKAMDKPKSLISIGNYLSQYDDEHGVFWLKHHATVIFEIDFKNMVFAVDGYSQTDKNAVNTLFSVIGINMKFVTRQWKNVMLNRDVGQYYKFLGFGNTESLIKEYVYSVKEKC